MLRGLIDIVVIPFVLFDELVRPIYRPVIQALARLPLMRLLEARVATLPPYGVLAVFLVPFIIAEPLKILGLYWLGTGRFRTGLVTLALAHGATFLLVERLFSAGRSQLMTIGWFARLVTLVERVRDAVLAAVRGTRFWQAARTLAKDVRARMRALIASLRTR